MHDLSGLIDGRRSESGEWHSQTHKSLGEVRFQSATEADIDAAFESMSNPIKPIKANTNQIERVLLEIDRHFLTYAKWYSAETGYLLRDALGMVGAAKLYCSDLCGATQFSSNAAVLPFSPTNQFFTRNARVVDLPRGRIAFILPANSPWPLALIYGLAANQSQCRALILPSSKTPVSGLAAAKCLEALGPNSGVSILNASTKNTLERATSEKCLDAIHFVGSNRLYADIAANCARNGLSLTYEGEGNCVAIVDTNINAVPTIAKTIRDAALRCNGQLCSSISGVLCASDCFDALRSELVRLFQEIKVGDGLDESSDLGSLLGSSELLTMATSDAITKGARLLAGGEGIGRVFPATLVEISEEQWDFALKENFGPIVWLRRLREEDDPIRLLDEIGSGLTVSVFGDRARGYVDRLISRARFARVCIDCDPTIQSPSHPWGNYGTSGFSPTASFAQKCLLPVSIESREEGVSVVESPCLKMSQPGRLENSVYSCRPPKQHVLVKNLYSGVCGTDREVFRGNLEAAFPFIPGHENVGQVVALPDGRSAANGEKLSEGDFVAWNPLIACGKCASCSNGRENCCLHLQVFGLGLTSEIEPHLFGGWSQSSLLSPSTQIHKISEDSNIKSFVFSDPAATAIRVFKQASHHVGEWLVIGSGALGCAIAASLKALGVECLWMAGNPDQRESAGPFCGEQFIEMTRTSSLTASKMLSLGLRPVCIVDTIGSTESIDACIEAAEPGASIFLVGGLVVRKIPFNSGALTKSEISIRGVLAYTNDEFAKAVKLIQSHPDVFGRIRTREIPLSVARESVFLRSDRKVIINCQT